MKLLSTLTSHHSTFIWCVTAHAQRPSRRAGPILAAGELPAKHIANVVVSLAKQGHLSADVAAAACALLERDLTACNGQDVSQILHGLMLGHTSGLSSSNGSSGGGGGAADGPVATFAAIAPALAASLRDESIFQTQAVSRILSSYAKVGCHSSAVFDAGVARLCGALKDLKPAFVSELAWAVATAGRGDDAFMRRVGAAAKRRFSEYTPPMLCSLLWSFGASGAFHADVFNLAASKLTPLIGRGQLGHADVVLAATGIAQSGYRHSALLRATADWLGANHARAPPASAAALLAALHTFGMAPERVCARVAPTLAAAAPALGRGDRSAIVDAVWVLGTRASPAAHVREVDALLARFDAVGGVDASPQLGAATLGRLARGVGAVAAAVPHSNAGAALPHLAAHAAQRAPDLAAAPGALVDTIAGVAAGGLRSDALMNAAAPHLAARAPRLTVKQLCDAAAAYSQAGVVHARLFLALAPRVREARARGELSVEHAATLAWSYALQGLLHGPLVPALCQTIAVRA